MAEKDDNKRPIIIKKIKKGGHGHHGGAWKVAYADFVTAMMAFFLLLWLLSTSSKATLEGIAEYFTPTVGLAGEKGIGFDGGATPNTVGIKRANTSSPGIVTGQTPSGQTPDAPDKQSTVESTEDGYLFDQAQQAMQKALESDPTLREFADNIIVEQTPEGLKLEVMDSDKHPMFVQGKADLTDAGAKVMTKMRGLIEKMPNFISITGHTDGAAGKAEGANAAGYSNWELSADRANAARRFLLKVGLDPERPKKVVGMADKELIDANDPRSPRNRRVTIILLRGSHMNLAPGYTPADRDILNLTPPKE